MKPAISISIEDAAWKAIPHLTKMTKRAITACIDETNYRSRAGSELSILLCGDARMRELNNSWRGIDKPTNVLSFPLADVGGESLLGDIAIAYQTLDREARLEDKTFSDHYLHLIVHGFLHLLGFDHETDDEAEQMEACETRTLARLAVADPYGETPKIKGSA